MIVIFPPGEKKIYQLIDDFCDFTNLTMEKKEMRKIKFESKTVVLSLPVSHRLAPNLVYPNIWVPTM